MALVSLLLALASCSKVASSTNLGQIERVNYCLKYELGGAIFTESGENLSLMMKLAEPCKGAAKCGKSEMSEK